MLMFCKLGKEIVNFVNVNVANNLHNIFLFYLKLTLKKLSFNHQNQEVCMTKLKRLIFIIFSLFFISITACSTKQSATENPAKALEVAKKHPPMEEMDCAICHQNVTEDLVKQWQQSAHGFTGVKCQVCHGDEANFSPKPANEVCRGCHSDQFENSVAKETACSTCHIAHNFNIHKIQQYK